jgi:hypothetical protein
MKPLEEAFYHGRYLFNRHQEFTCAKGMNTIDRMRCLESLVGSLKNPFVIGLDGSAFDAHVVKQALKAEWKFYDIAWKQAGYRSATIDKMRRMGKQQLVNRVSGLTKTALSSTRSPEIGCPEILTLDLVIACCNLCSLRLL